MGADVDRDVLVDEVTQLATDHADLVIAVSKLLDRSTGVPAGSACRVVHLCQGDIDELRRLTGAT